MGGVYPIKGDRHVVSGLLGGSSLPASFFNFDCLAGRGGRQSQRDRIVRLGRYDLLNQSDMGTDR